MIKVLILDDNQIKVRKIIETLKIIHGCTFDIASDIVTARKYLVNEYDLMILDMNLPNRFDDVPKANQGMKFLLEIRSSSRLKLPKNIIGLSEFEEIITEYQDQFSNLALQLIKYDLTSIDWEVILKEKIQYLIQVEKQSPNNKGYDYDVAFITALRNPEFEALLKLPYNWEKVKLNNDNSNYFTGKVKVKSGDTINIIATYLPQMGMVAAAATTTKIILRFQPRYIIMTGICAGIKDKVTLGDIIACDLSFDFGSGKVLKDKIGQEKFHPDFKSIPIASELKEDFLELSSNKEVLRNILDLWEGEEVSTSLKLHIGPVGSGAAVIENSDYTSRILSHQRKLIAVDMETYSIFYCCQVANAPKPTAISVKSVCDFADQDKNDGFQKFCSFTSSNIADYIIKNILSYN